MKYFRNGVKQEIDTYAFSDEAIKIIDNTDYQKWLDELFDGVIETKGIRNEKDLFTASGNRRSFDSLHYAVTLENVVKAMKEQGEQGIGSFGTGNIFGSSAEKFNSVDEAKRKMERLQNLTQEEFDEIRDGFRNRFFEIIKTIPNSDSFGAIDDATNVLTESIQKYKTKSGIANYIKREVNGWGNYNDYIVDDLIELVADIRNMPTQYFEAKPQRAVGLSEGQIYLIPETSSNTLKKLLKDNKLNYVEYDKDEPGARAEILNTRVDEMFSLKHKDIANDETRLILKENEKLKESVEILKGEFKLTKGHKVKRSSVEKMARKHIRGYNSKIDVKELVLQSGFPSPS